MPLPAWVSLVTTITAAVLAGEATAASPFWGSLWGSLWTSPPWTESSVVCSALNRRRVRALAHLRQLLRVAREVAAKDRHCG